MARDERAQADGEDPALSSAGRFRWLPGLHDRPLLVRQDGPGLSQHANSTIWLDPAQLEAPAVGEMRARAGDRQRALVACRAEHEKPRDDVAGREPGCRSTRRQQVAVEPQPVPLDELARPLQAPRPAADLSAESQGCRTWSKRRVFMREQEVAGHRSCVRGRSLPAAKPETHQEQREAGCE